MAEIRERSPSEIRTEKRLRNFSLSPTQQQPSGNYFNHFRENAKVLIDYHLDKQKPRPRQEEPPVDFYVPPKPGRKKQAPRSPYKEPETSEEFEKIKQLISKRAYLVEGAVKQLQGLSKPLATVKVTTNRELLVKQVMEVEEAHLSVVNDMESHLLSVHDSLRAIDKVAQIHAHEQKDLARQVAKETRDELQGEVLKHQQKVKALSDHNTKLSAQARAESTNKEMAEKLRKLEASFSSLTKEHQRQSEFLSDKQQEISGLQTANLDKSKEVERLCEELNDLNRQIIDQQGKYEDEIRHLQMSAKAFAEQAEAKDKVMALEAKDHDIRRLKNEVLRLEDDLNSQVNQARLQEESRLKEFSALKDEIKRLQDFNMIATRNDDAHRMRLALEEKDRALHQERERFQIELENREHAKNKQKNEWAEIYTSMKHEIKELRTRNEQLLRDNEHLARQPSTGQIDLLKQRIKEKDFETKALWDVIVELTNTYQTKGRIDINDIRTLLVIKHLEDKARSKIRF